jgi:hypothetical protein
MKKKSKKLTLHRETLRSMEDFRMRGVVGAATIGLRCNDGDTVGGECISAGTCQPNDTTTGTPTIFATCGACSDGCATGGACTT